MGGMRLADLVETSIRVAATRSRTAKVAALAEMLRRLAPDEIEIAVSFVAGGLRQGRIGLGPAVVRAVRAAAPVSGVRPDGAGALTLGEVDRAFSEIAAASGAGSTAERGRRLGALFAAASAEEQELLARLILGELRQGALAGLVVEALAAAAMGGPLPADEVRRAVMLSGDLTAVARAALLAGRPGLGEFRLRLFRPLQPMLAQTAEDPGAALERLGEAAFELKLDGARIQAHKDGDEVRVYSRLGNDVTVAVPEVVEVVRALPARRVVLDGEAIALRGAPGVGDALDAGGLGGAIDAIGGAPHPFQVTMRRFGRKLDVERLRAELPLTPFFFDLLHLDGDDLVDRPAAERFAALAAAAPGFTVPRRVTASEEEADAFFAAVLRGGHEGLLAKALDAPYEAGRRGFGWLKIKPAHTLDLVVLAVERGSGRRSAWLSNLHLGARDPHHGGFVMLGKTFKGLTDEMLAWQTATFRRLAIGAGGEGGGLGAEGVSEGAEGVNEGRGEWVVHVRPEVVVEIAFGDVQESPHYPGGMALRFARVKRYRSDKTAAEADTIDTVRAIFAAGHTGHAGKGRAAEHSLS
jgi:DNA ligase-1